MGEWGGALRNKNTEEVSILEGGKKRGRGGRESDRHGFNVSYQVALNGKASGTPRAGVKAENDGWVEIRGLEKVPADRDRP